MRFLIAGAGAIGGYIGACMARAGLDVYALRRFAHNASVARELLARNLAPVDPHALPYRNEVRRGVETSAQTGGAADCVEHRGRRAFAVCARYLD